MTRPAVAPYGLYALHTDADVRVVAACPLAPTPAPSPLVQHLRARPLGLDGAFQPARFLSAVAVATNDLPAEALGPAQTQRMIAPQPQQGLDADCINRVLDSLCVALPPGLWLHDAPRR